MMNPAPKQPSNKNIPDTVALDDSRSALVIVDQTLLPREVRLLYLTETKDIHEAIRSLRVRGAPAIGVAAAIGLYLAAKSIRANSFPAFWEEFQAAKSYLATSRPTAVNLFWALDRMEQTALKAKAQPLETVVDRLRQEADTMLEEDIQVCRAIGEHGLSLLKHGMGILTHCNAGRLAAVRYGTALAPIYIGQERGLRFKVYADETRPLLQGARLTAWELSAAGVDTTVICDNMASQVMKNGWVQAVITGADRISANGDCCNKIGTSGVAILAKHYGIPMYVCAPTSTIDMSLANGSLIPIEERPGEEIRSLWYTHPMVTNEVHIFNPAFDVTDHSMVSAIITEKGILTPPYEQSLSRLF